MEGKGEREAQVVKTRGTSLEPGNMELFGGSGVGGGNQGAILRQTVLFSTVSTPF
jgi:hypothetical protein